jgi:hypothetical protein
MRSQQFQENHAPLFSRWDTNSSRMTTILKNEMRTNSSKKTTLSRWSRNSSRKTKHHSAQGEIYQQFQDEHYSQEWDEYQQFQENNSLKVRSQLFQENHAPLFSWWDTISSRKTMLHSSQGEIPTAPGRPCTTLLKVSYQKYQEDHSSVGVYCKYCY